MNPSSSHTLVGFDADALCRLKLCPFSLSSKRREKLELVNHAASANSEIKENVMIQVFGIYKKDLFESI